MYYDHVFFFFFLSLTSDWVDVLGSELGSADVAQPLDGDQYRNLNTDTPITNVVIGTAIDQWLKCSRRSATKYSPPKLAMLWVSWLVQGADAIIVQSHVISNVQNGSLTNGHDALPCHAEREQAG
jgi:hypothetical protein